MTDNKIDNFPSMVNEKTAQAHIAIVAKCFEAYFSQPLIACAAGEDLLAKVWAADFVLLSHSADEDPCFNFGNLSAQRLFEMDYLTLTALASRKSAGPSTQRERDALLAQVSRHGCIDDYRGIRVSASGKQFYIEQAKVWNLTDAKGNYYGQAAMFRDWTDL